MNKQEITITKNNKIMTYLEKYQSIKLDELPKEYSSEFSKLFQMTEGFTNKEITELCATTFDDLYNVVSEKGFKYLKNVAQSKPTTHKPTPTASTPNKSTEVIKPKSDKSKSNIPEFKSDYLYMPKTQKEGIVFEEKYLKVLEKFKDDLGIWYICEEHTEQSYRVAPYEILPNKIREATKSEFDKAVADYQRKRYVITSTPSQTDKKVTWNVKKDFDYFKKYVEDESVEPLSKLNPKLANELQGLIEYLIIDSDLNYSQVFFDDETKINLHNLVEQIKSSLAKKQTTTQDKTDSKSKADNKKATDQATKKQTALTAQRAINAKLIAAIKDDQKFRAKLKKLCKDRFDKHGKYVRAVGVGALPSLDAQLEKEQIQTVLYEIALRHNVRDFNKLFRVFDPEKWQEIQAAKPPTTKAKPRLVRTKADIDFIMRVSNSKTNKAGDKLIFSNSAGGYVNLNNFSDADFARVLKKMKALDQKHNQAA